ncbi:MAG: acylneuraminate cytidylyltransferase [Bdellovibrionaceae bacterium]|nr:acylneuraminate cytidylyltransferase [Pseudobdellovibrionaceae bacterium]MBX3033944.1 acylneuraminate cytidylyltransferase [Pseudobdellovibrionaceae bacterium]
MKKTLAVTLIALSFATGFTCSKQAPEAPPAPEATQEQMATPPVDGAVPAEPTAPPADAPAAGH